MLEQEKHVFDAAGSAKSDELFLQAQAFVVGDTAEIEILDHRVSLL